ncbi:unnamed protein product [Prorocentrum cordatum]|uniref:SMB domain-containing protein n=1 Tax=Prorocentrum cordatum TaxID=2364126 RepID=A0ABN9REU8_9DINO|nr:unnamed protein product [Polarella glacialis]
MLVVALLSLCASSGGASPPPEGIDWPALSLPWRPAPASLVQAMRPPLPWSPPLQCTDNATFRDSLGFPCTDWIDYTCDRAAQVEGWGYTKQAQDDILSNCKLSCGLCETDGALPKDRGNCFSEGCYAHNKSKGCQCNPMCEMKKDCCYDYEARCYNRDYPDLLPDTAGSCIDNGCHGYDKSVSCQCNPKCVKYKNCCHDFRDRCKWNIGNCLAWQQIPANISRANYTELCNRAECPFLSISGPERAGCWFRCVPKWGCGWDVSEMSIADRDRRVCRKCSIPGCVKCKHGSRSKGVDQCSQQGCASGYHVRNNECVGNLRNLHGLAFCRRPRR